MKEDRAIEELKKLKIDFENIEVPAELDFAIEKGISKGEKEKRDKKKRLYKSCLAIAASITLIAFTFSLSSGLKHKWNGESKPEAAVAGKEKNNETMLPVVGSLENLQQLLKEYKVEEDRLIAQDAGMRNETSTIKGSASVTGKAEQSKSSSSKDTAKPGDYNMSIKDTEDKEISKGDYSTTNIQVKGVDEGDIVKTDGEYIYSTNQNSVLITKAYPATDMRVVKRLDISSNFHPSQLYLEENYLVVIGENYKDRNEILNDKAKRMYAPKQSTKLFVFDIEDKSNPRQIRELEVDGQLTSSRMIDADVYVILNKEIRVMDSIQDKNMELRPCYKDSLIGTEYKVVDFDKISYCQDAIAPNYIMVAALNLKKLNEEVKVTTCLGSGENIYVSDGNIYVAGVHGSIEEQNGFFGGIEDRIVDRQNKTVIYKFNLKQGNVQYAGKGEVPGYSLNQFSMDESNGYLRISTTSQEKDTAKWVTTQKNNVYVLDEAMSVTGKLEDLAAGEKIYATRFIGDRAYMVTFKNTDPLFVIDMKDPKNPKVLGELKIPGFSNYLQPYDENHIIGFGMDTQALNIEQMGKTEERVFTQGMKIAFFDVSDVKNPKQQFMTKIGDRGTNSPLLQDHKALLFSKEKNMLAFPIQVAEKDKNAVGNRAVIDYGNIVFNGAYVYTIDMEKGFVLKGTVTHEAIDKGGMYNYGEWRENSIQRILYIKDSLYTLSENYLKANQIGDLSEVKEVDLKN